MSPLRPGRCLRRTETCQSWWRGPFRHTCLITVFRAMKKPTGLGSMKGQPPLTAVGVFRTATSLLGSWAALSTFSFGLTLKSLARTGLSQKCEKMLFQQEQKQTSLLAPELLSEPAWIPTVCWAWACSFTEELVHSGLMIIFSCYSDHDDGNNEDVMVVTLPPPSPHPLSCHQASAPFSLVHLPPKALSFRRDFTPSL